MKRVSVVLGIAVLLALTVVLWRGSPLQVNLAEVTTGTVREYIAEDAKTRLDDTFTVDMPLSGTVERIQKEVGDYVEKGEVLTRIDPYSLEQTIKSTEAMIIQARSRILGVDKAKPKPEDIDSAALRIREAQDNVNIAQKNLAIVEIDCSEAKKDYDRTKELVSSGVVSQSVLDKAEGRFMGLAQRRDSMALAEQAAGKALEVSQLASRRLVSSVDDNEYMRNMYLAEIDGLTARINMLKDDLKKTEILAPASGPILQKHVDDRRVLPAGTALLTVGDLTSIDIECDVLSEEVVRVEVGDPVEIGGKALQNRTVMGQVERIYPAGFMKISALGIEQQRVRVIIDFDNESANLRPGTSVDLRIITDEHSDVLTVPERALFRSDGQWAVFKVNSGRAKLTPVSIGLKNDDFAEITEGLVQGDIVVAEPSNDLQDDARVSAAS